MEQSTTNPTGEPDHLEEPTNEELRLLSRRSALRLLGGAGLAVIAACVTDGVTSTTAGTASSTSATAGNTATTTFGGVGACVLIPEETEGPYPLDLSGDEQFYRTDITEGPPGVPLTLTLSLVDVNAGCAAIEGARIDVWHCDAEGVYSGVSQPGIDTTGDTFCRGIQLTDANGQATFQTIYPGWYQGRITHVHFQVFFDSGLVATSQIAFPEDVTSAAYALEPYAAKGPNTSVRTIEEDMVFSDGSQYQMAAITGAADARYIATLLVGVAV